MWSRRHDGIHSDQGVKINKNTGKQLIIITWISAFWIWCYIDKNENSSFGPFDSMWGALPVPMGISQGTILRSARLLSQIFTVRYFSLA